MRQEVIEEKFSEYSVGSLSMTWCSHGSARLFMLALSSAWLWLSAIARLKAEHDCLQQRIHAMYVDSWTDESMAGSSAGCRQNGAWSRPAASRTSSATRQPTSPT